MRTPTMPSSSSLTSLVVNAEVNDFLLFWSNIELIDFYYFFNLDFASLSSLAGYDWRIGVSLIISLVAKNIGRPSFSASTFNAKHNHSPPTHFDTPCLFFTIPGILSLRILHSVSFGSVISSFKNLAVYSSTYSLVLSSSQYFSHLFTVESLLKISDGNF